MTLEIVCEALGWCTVINYGFLMWWFAAFVLGHDWIYRFHGRWFHLSMETFEAVHYGGMGIFKIGILLFNLVPYIALRIALG